MNSLLRPLLILGLLAAPLATTACLSGSEVDGIDIRTDNDGNNGTANNGTANNGTANNGGQNNGTANNGATNNGDTNNGDTNNGATNNGDTNNGATNNGATNNGATNNGGTNNGGTPCEDRDRDGIPAGDCPGIIDCDDNDASRSQLETEVCDGIDNDCDEQIDEDVSAPRCERTSGVCLNSRKICAGEVGFADCSEESYGPDFVDVETIEHCDGLDNDCDGLTDEECPCTDGETTSCGIDTGACEFGVQTCQAGLWGACLDDVGPLDEACDGLDNDCDGTTDNGLTAPSCQRQRGVCAGARKRCLGTDGWSICSAQEYGASFVDDEGTAQCDGLDNDCDGEVDEGCACRDGQTRECGSDVGECQLGAETCVQGQWGACTGAVGPANTDACDGKDNDCDGEVDEGCPCQPNETRACGTDTGECVAGSQSCQNGQWGTCSGVGPVAEVCDGKDNNCDGRTDEGVLNACGTCGPAPTETCDGVDNDCDGSVDEGVTNACGTCGPAPTEVCDTRDNDCDGSVDEGVTNACGTCGAVPAEVCDGADNNCNGQTDETNPALYSLCPPPPFAQNSACTNGRCIFTCISPRVDANGDLYNANSNGCECTPSGQEVCDGVDNDCDGMIDEGLTFSDYYPDADNDGFGNATAPAVRACARPTGHVADHTDCDDTRPNVNPQAPEICDGLNNNCNATTDEQNAALLTNCAARTGASPSTCANGTCHYACNQGFVDVNGDLNAASSNGCECRLSGQEVCDGLDNDCDGATDLDDTDVERYSCVDQLPVPVSPIGDADNNIAPMFEFQGSQRRFRVGAQPCEGNVVIGMNETAVCYAGSDDLIWCAGQLADIDFGSSFVRFDAMNEAARLGNNVPTQILMGLDQTMCVVTSALEAWCVGFNNSGMFGTTQSAARSPVRWGNGQVGAIAWMAMADYPEVCVMTPTGNIWCAGQRSGSSPRAAESMSSTRFGINPAQRISRDQSLYLQGFTIFIDDPEYFRVTQGMPWCRLSGNSGLLDCQQGTWPREYHTWLVDGGNLFAGDFNTCWLDRDALVVCENGNGLPAPMFFDTNRDYPGPGVVQAIAMYPGQAGLCAVYDDGSLHCVGDNTAFRFGTNSQYLDPPGVLVQPARSVRTGCR